MRFRKLRIAWSVTCGVACVLLIVFWVQSYFRYSQLTNKRGECVIESWHGRLWWMWPEYGVLPVKLDVVPADRYVDVLTRLKITRPTGVFGFAIGHRVPGVCISHWFAVALAMVFAAVPWILWRFSLRTLLIATTLVAVVLGLIVYAVR